VKFEFDDRTPRDNPPRGLIEKVFFAGASLSEV